MSKWLVLCLLLWVQVNLQLLAEPIPGSLLFKEAQTKSLKFSPNSRYVMGKYLTENGTSLTLIDPLNDQRYEVFNLAFGVRRTSNFYWVDDDTVLIESFGRNVTYRAFIDIDIKGKTFKPTVINVNARGTVVDTLEQVDNEVLFSRYEGKILTKHVLYRITTEQLVSGNFAAAKVYGEPLDDAIEYISDPDNNRILAISSDDEEVHFWYRDEGSNKWHLVGEILLHDHDFTPVGLLDSHTLAVLSNEKTDFTALIEFNLKTQSYGNILYQNNGNDLTDARLTKGGKGIEYVRYFEQGRLVTRFFTEQSKAVEQLLKAAFSGKQFIIVDQKHGHDNRLVFVFGSDDPGGYYLFDGKGSKSMLLGRISTELDAYNMAPSQTFTVKTDAQTQVEAILTLAINKANGVLLVIPHGGPIGIREVDGFDPEVQYLASRGFSVLKVNFRGSSGFGKKFEQSGVGQLGKAIEKDITTVVEQVRTRHNFNQMCSMGTSYGGYSAMMLAMLHPDDYHCVISMFGIYDLPQLFSASNTEQRPQKQKAIRAVVGENNAALRLVSPFYMAEKLKAPLLLVAGTEDKVAWFEQSDRMRYRLKQLNKPFELLFYKNTKHGHSNYKGDRHQFAYISQFLQQHLDLPSLSGEKTKAVELEEALLLADAHEFKHLTTQNSVKALSYYRKAAQLGDGRAMFNLASFYHRGEVVDKDIPKAAHWYQRASDAGYADAGFRLAGMINDGKLGTVDEVRALKLYQAAKENGHDMAFLEIAKARCMGKGIKRDLATCITTLTDSNIVEKKTRTRRGEIIADLFFATGLSAEDINRLKRLVATVLEQTMARTLRDTPVNISHWGIFDDENDHIATTAHVGLNGDHRFGIALDLPAMKQVENGDFAVFKVRWTKTTRKDRQAMPDKDVEQKLWYFRVYKEDSRTVHIVKKDWPKVKSDWLMEVYTLDGQKRFEKSFTIEPEQ